MTPRLVLFTILVAHPLFAADIVPAGAGSYATTLPAGAKAPPAIIHKTDRIRGPIPTNDWCSSLAWMGFSERQFAHPLSLRTTPAGLQVYYPGAAISVAKVGIIAGMPGGGQDLVLGHSAAAKFTDARLDAFSDWFVTARFAAETASMTVSYGHGSPYVYATYEGGNPTVTFASPPVVWDKSETHLAVTVAGRSYLLCGPTGCGWSGLDGRTFTCETKGKTYFTLALLPDKTPKTVALFRRCFAHNHVTDTKVEWSFDEKASTVTTRFAFTTRPMEGTEAGTLFALYPHQWRSATADLTGQTYASVRGTMKLARGAGFTTKAAFHGVLPALPDAGACDKALLARYVHEDSDAKPQPLKDTYWEGKYLGKLATLVPLAEQAGDADASAKLLAELKRRLESWLTAADSAGQLKRTGLFVYDRNWGTLIGYPASYGSDVELNDHHFHYGYFLRAAAEIARHDPAWAADGRFGAMLRLLVRDIAADRRDDPMFPFLRNFDPYAGHSWASGHARFADGNNNESSSEAMNAWCALILLGQALSDRAMRDLGIYLYTTEMQAINAYWFDVLNENRPPTYTPSVVTMVWGAKSVNETWFDGRPEAVHAINWLPFHGGSLYLGLYPDYVKRNYAALLKEKGDSNWRLNADLILMYRALDDAGDALEQFNENVRIEAGNSRASLYHWLHTLDALGHVDRTVTADWPLYAVFVKGNQKSYVAWNTTGAERTVTFSDGATVRVEAGNWGVVKP